LQFLIRAFGKLFHIVDQRSRDQSCLRLTLRAP
jgi:hypothetical protein